MASNRIPRIAASVLLTLLASACSNSRPAATAGTGPNPETCVFCHGSVGRVGNLPGTDPLLASAPPAVPNGRPASMTGAHQVHLNPPINGPLRAPIACNECHVVPANIAHATNPPANPVEFGVLARARGASPTYEALSLGCAAVYCHGNFDFNGVKGKAASVVWDGGVVGCGACHDLPPTGHPPLAGGVTPATCSQCHPSTVNGDGSINVTSGAHINGQADVSFRCTTCHGTEGRVGFQQGTDPDLASAPPIAPPGAPAHAVGAHQPHLNPPVTGSITGPLACSECHVVPTTPDHATNPPAAKVVFGTLATTQDVVPVWTSTTTGCAATYCHGNFSFNGVAGSNATPLWTDGPLGCVSCHGMPPTGHPTLTGTVTPATCSACHPDTVTGSGSINLAAGGHLNGRADVLLDCTSCHGTAGRTGIQPGTDPLLASAPPVAPTGAPAFAVGAHQRHLNPPATGSFRGPVACSECHLVPSSSDHAANPPAQKVVFGTLATTQGSTPTWNVTPLGCSATYCHGTFSFNGVSGSSATPLWTATGLTCTSCHGMPPTGHPAIAGTVTAATCSQCHPSSVRADGTIDLTSGTHLNGQANVNFDCTSCHGTAGRVGILAGTDPQLAAAPPVVTSGSPPSAEGAHLRHVNPSTANALRAPLRCNECHVVPTDIGHATNPPPSPVVFGALARTQGNSPVWNGTTLGCSATYCHGGFDFNGVRGASGTPVWTDTNIQCVNCHGLPPTGHPALPGTVTPATCSQCHPSTVNPNGTINVGPSGGGHVNGVANVAAGCTSCHGTAGRPVTATNPLLDSAPPVAPAGTDPARVVGTHLLHLQDGTIRAGVSCDNCHVVPGNADHSIQFPQRVVFTAGTLATTQGVSPSYDATALSCSATYCHGNFTFGAVRGNAAATAAWNATPTLSCTGCHGMPPTGHPPLTGTVTAATCSQCHPATVQPSGAIDVAGGKHMNGASDVTGNPHSSDPLWVDRTHHGFAASSQGMQSCTNCHVGFGGPSGGGAGSCNACHTAVGFATWQTNCTFCHGTTGRPTTTLNPQLAAAPPVDSAGNGDGTPRARGVGAHSKHLLSPTVSVPFSCANCHATPSVAPPYLVVPTNVDHVDGQRAAIPFGLIAKTGNVTPSYNAASLGCSATYCHGNFTNGRTTVTATRPDPVWTSTTALTCNNCHNMPTATTGRHSKHGGSSFNCSECHFGIASGTSAATAAITQPTGPTLHVNGTVNVVFAPSITLTSTGTGSSRRCNGTCHSKSHSSLSW